MLLVLFFLGIVILISIVILGFILSKVEIFAKDITIDTRKKIVNFQINISIYFFYLLKIINLKIDNQDIKINGIKPKKFISIEVKNKKILRIIVLKIIQEKMSDIVGKEVELFKDDVLNKINIQKFDVDVKKLNINIEIGTEDAILTSFLVLFLAVVINFFYLNLFKNQKNKNRYNVYSGNGVKKDNCKAHKDLKNNEYYENYKYVVSPKYYNCNLIRIEISSKLNLNMIHILNLVLSYYKIKKILE